VNTFEEKILPLVGLAIVFCTVVLTVIFAVVIFARVFGRCF
jgi:hypothetical protein